MPLPPSKGKPPWPKPLLQKPLMDGGSNYEILPITLSF